MNPWSANRLLYVLFQYLSRRTLGDNTLEFLFENLGTENNLV